jgi:hypothetical protein
MRAWTIVSLSILIGAAPGCKKSKKDRCDDIYRQMIALVEEMAKQLGGEPDDKPTAEDKKQFMALCEKLPDDAVSCMSLEKMGDAKCAEILAKAEAEVAKDAPPVALEWEEVTLEDTIKVKVPKGWEYEDFAGHRYQPPVSAKLGMMTTMAIQTTCGGTCDPLPAAEWAKRVEEQEVANLKMDTNATITRDEKLGDTGRLLQATVTLGRPMERLIVARWKDGASRYATCEVELSQQLTKNLAEFEKACVEMTFE